MTEQNQNGEPEVVRIRMRSPVGHPGQMALWSNTKKNVLVRAGRRGGKAQPLDAIVYTPHGPRRMGELNVGDHVLTPFGTSALVEAIYPQGEMNIYRMKFGDGSSAECTADHLWEIEEKRTDSRWKNRVKTLTTEQIGKMATVTQRGRGTSRRPTLPQTHCAMFDLHLVPLDPYLVGILIGDGGLADDCVRVSCDDPGMLSKIRWMCQPLGLSVRHIANCDYALSTRQLGRPNPLVRTLRDLGLMGRHSHEKFIPDRYKYNSREVRLELVRGLLDTDGTVDHNGQPRLEQTSARLAHDFAEVIQSLGGTVVCKTKMGAYRLKDGTRRETRIVYRQVVLYENAPELFALPRKKVKARRRAWPVKRYIHGVEYSRRAPAQCIKISDPRGLYLTNNFLATHNTTGLAMIGIRALLNGRRVLYAAPTIDQVGKFWDEVLRAFDLPIKQGLYYKNETQHILRPMWASDENDKRSPRIRAKTAYNAQSLRGDWADFLILDEYQIMDETAWNEVGAPMLIDFNGDAVLLYTPPSMESRSASKAKDPMHASKMWKEKQKDPDWFCIQWPTEANPHASKDGIEQARRRMSALAFRQEVMAQDVEEMPGALWDRQLIEDTRFRVNLFRDGRPVKINDLPEMRRVVVGVDPSGGNITEVGISVAGEGSDGHFYILRDASMRASRPKEWAQRSIQQYEEFAADRIVAERNYGGDMVKETIRNVNDHVSYRDVVSSRGKLVRAEPIAALFQQHKAHLVCQCGKSPCTEFLELEDELCTYTAQQGEKSPNRLDAMVFAVAELVGQGSFGVLEAVKSGMFERALNGLLGRGAPRVGYQPNGPATAPTSTPDVGTTAVKVQGSGTVKVETAGSLAAIANVRPEEGRNGCPKCGCQALQHPGGGGTRCSQCGHQFNLPELAVKLGAGRKIYFEKLGKR